MDEVEPGILPGSICFVARTGPPAPGNGKGVMRPVRVSKTSSL